MFYHCLCSELKVIFGSEKFRRSKDVLFCSELLVALVDEPVLSEELRTLGLEGREDGG